MRTVGYNGYQRKWVIRESDYWWLVTQPFWGNVCKVHFSCILLLRKILGEIIAFSSITTNHWIVNFHLYANVKHSNQLLRNWYVFARISAFWKQNFQCESFLYQLLRQFYSHTINSKNDQFSRIYLVENKIYKKKANCMLLCFAIF